MKNHAVCVDKEIERVTDESAKEYAGLVGVISKQAQC